MTTPPPYPPKFHHLRHGQVFNWWINTGHLRVVHIDSADFIEQELQGRQADIVCLCAIGRKYRPNYVKDVVRLLKPKYIIPCHWDTMVTPIDQPPKLLPGVNIPEFLEEIKACESNHYLCRFWVNYISIKIMNLKIKKTALSRGLFKETNYFLSSFTSVNSASTTPSSAFCC
jgi:hypothetical protein